MIVRFRAAVFDFDGTLSLIREGWAGIMADLGCDKLRPRRHLRPGDREYLEEEMLALSGRPSIDQMRRLADEERARGGQPGDPADYLVEFLERLFAVTDERKADLASGRVPPATWAVPGAEELLRTLRERGVELYLASGTEIRHVREELALLKFDRFFGDRVFAPADNHTPFQKRDVVEMILREQNIVGSQLLGVGDGASETAEVKRVGGYAIGVASQPAGTAGENAVKRRLLMERGADVVVPHYAPVRVFVASLVGATA